MLVHAQMRGGSLWNKKKQIPPRPGSQRQRLKRLIGAPSAPQILPLLNPRKAPLQSRSKHLCAERTTRFREENVDGSLLVSIRNR